MNNVGSQLRAWLLFFSLPVLNGILPEPYFSHYSNLVAATHIVLSDAISTADLISADYFFKKFYSQIASHYGMSTYVMHIITY